MNSRHLGSRRYHASSGLIYHERTTSSLPPLSLPYTSISQLVFLDGNSSLRTLVFEAVIANASELTVESLDALPWPIVKELYQELEKREQMTFAMWKMFARSHRGAPVAEYYRAAHVKPECRLGDYATALHSWSLSWLTFLTISPAEWNVTRAELVGLSQLINLAALDISGREDGLHGTSRDMVTNRLVRDWARRAQEDCGFPSLRVLIIRNQRAVCKQALQYLNFFPKLTLLGVKAWANEDWTKAEKCAKAVGWTMDDLDDKYARLRSELQLTQTWDEPIKLVWQFAENLALVNTASTPDVTPPSAEASPLLNFRVGLTPSDILYSTFLMFFRKEMSAHASESAQKRDAISSKALLASTSETPGSLGLETGRPSSTGADVQGKNKRLKLKNSRQVSIGSVLDDLDMGTAWPSQADLNFLYTGPPDLKN